jgi:hypothetical protein
MPCLDLAQPLAISDSYKIDNRSKVRNRDPLISERFAATPPRLESKIEVAIACSGTWDPL